MGRDECWCPSNSTGKFCHLPAPSLEKKQGGRAPNTPPGGSMKHSTYTLPLSNQLGERGRVESDFLNFVGELDLKTHPHHHFPCWWLPYDASFLCQKPRSP